MNLLIKNARIITMDKDLTEISKGFISIKDGKIVEIAEGEYPNQFGNPEKVIDAEGKVVFPGLINTHTHLFQTLLKGLGRDKPLIEWLDASVRNALPYYDKEACYNAALIGCMESIHSGTTTIMDYMYCHTKAELDDAIIEAFKDIGIRGILGRAYSNVSGLPKRCDCEIIETVPMCLNDVERLLNKYPSDEDDMITIALAPGIIWDLTKEEYKMVRHFANEHQMLIAMHLVETENDDKFSLERDGKRTIEFLDDIGFLGPDVVSVHSVHMQPSDIETYKKWDVKVSYNPTANMILGSGVPPVKDFMEAGLTVGLATDGAASNDSQDMIETLKNAALLQKVFYRDATIMSAMDVLKMATINGAVTVNKEKSIGSLEPGKRADMFIFNPMTAKTMPMHDPVTALVYSSGEENVETTIINGKVVMENRKILNINEEEVLKKSAVVGARLRAQAGI